MNEIKNRIAKLRNKKLIDKVDYVFVPTNDYHLSENIGEFFKCREYITGFNGSAGDALIGLNEAYLWVDSRYFIQAEYQLKGTDIKLFKMGEKGVPTIKEFLNKNIKSNQTFAVNYAVIDVTFGGFLEELSLNNGVKLLNKDYFDDIWDNRPSISQNEGFMLPKSLTGLDRKDKIKNIQEEMKNDNADYHLVASLDDVMWILNIRGDDVAYSPVMLSYILIGRDSVTFYAFEKCLSKKMKSSLINDGIEIKSYYELFEDIALIHHKKVVLDSRRVNFNVYSVLKKDNFIIHKDNYSQMLKVIKNKTEIKNMKLAHLYDAVSMIKFIYYVKHTKDAMTELSLMEKLNEFRGLNKTFIEPSFESIVGFKHHGAIVHYSASEETSINVEGDSLLLVDSGGQYLNGTTDITRTLVIGKVNNEIKKHFTMVLKAHLALYDFKFKNLTGAGLDSIVRAPMWKEGLEFKHSTGHGIGCLLNCHEGPNGISFVNRTLFKEGMMTSNEPGLYLEDRYGIRHENIMLCKKCHGKFEDYLTFEQMTLVPFDIEGIDKRLLTKEEKNKLNAYHKKVYSKVSKYLTSKEKNWLRKQTKAI